MEITTMNLEEPFYFSAIQNPSGTIADLELLVRSIQVRPTYLPSALQPIMTMLREIQLQNASDLDWQDSSRTFFDLKHRESSDQHINTLVFSSKNTLTAFGLNNGYGNLQSYERRYFRLNEKFNSFSVAFSAQFRKSKQPNMRSCVTGTWETPLNVIAKRPSFFLFTPPVYVRQTYEGRVPHRHRYRYMTLSTIWNRKTI